MTVFSVSQIGIFRTEDLMDHADLQIHEDLRPLLTVSAKADIIESGRCLAVSVDTASGFHMWRAVETVMGDYYLHLSGETFKEAKVMRNWGQYIKLLNDAKADEKITVFLDHIREEYRNPISHPEAVLSPQEAFNLFGTAISAISQMLLAMKTTAPKSKLLPLTASSNG